MSQTIERGTSIFTEIYVNKLLYNVITDIREKNAIQNLATSISCQRDVWKHFKNLRISELKRVQQFIK